MHRYETHRSALPPDGDAESAGASDAERPPPAADSGGISVDLLDDQSAVRVPETRLIEAVRTVCRLAGVTSAEISVSVVDNARIHQLNRRFLQHDYPTDVLSFAYAVQPARPQNHDRRTPPSPEGVVPATGCHLEGEIIVSGEMAAERAAEFGWAAEEELLLYVVHGTWHLCGLDDATAEQKSVMRNLERRALEELGIRWADAPNSPARTDGEKE